VVSPAHKVLRVPAARQVHKVLQEPLACLVRQVREVLRVVLGLRVFKARLAFKVKPEPQVHKVSPDLERPGSLVLRGHRAIQA